MVRPRYILYPPPSTTSTLTHADPDAASDFKAQVVQNIPEIEPGHQCYKLTGVPSVEAGTNATIQLQYWSNYEDDDSADEKFYACADVVCPFLLPPCFRPSSLARIYQSS